MLVNGKWNEGGGGGGEELEAMVNKENTYAMGFPNVCFEDVVGTKSAGQKIRDKKNTEGEILLGTKLVGLASVEGKEIALSG